MLNALPDRETMQLRFERLAKAATTVHDLVATGSDDHQKALGALLTLGDAPVDMIVLHPDWLEDALTACGLDSPFDGATVDHETLAEYKQRIWLRIMIRDECGAADVMETAAHLAELADRVTRSALDVAAAEGQTPLLMALGKWGGRELNVASDIDPVFFGKGELTGSTGDRLVRSWLSILMRSPGKEIYPVDLRLRPEGSQGPLVTSFSELERYFFQRAAPWERIAWLRARPVAGEMPDWLRQLLNAFLFGSRDDPRQRVIEVARSLITVRKSAKPRDIKRGLGGIRDVEFLVASLQLTYGRHNKELQTGTVPELLSRLLTNDLLTPTDALALSEGYLFSRRIEHALQSEQAMPKFLVPKHDSREHERLAGRLGHDSQSFELAWTQHRTRVLEIVSRILPMDTSLHDSATLTVDPQRDQPPSGLEEDSRTLAAIRRLGGGQVDIRELCAPEHLEGHPDAGEALHLLESAVHAYGGTSPWRESFGSKRDLRKEITRLFLYGPRVVEEANSNPVLFDRIGLSKWEPGEINSGDTKVLRRRLGELVFHLGERFVAHDLDAMELTKRWTEEVDRTVDALAGRELALNTPPTAVIALGKWGGRELAPDADLDMMLVCADADPSEVADAVRRGTDFLSHASLNGTLLLDPRLRPEGSGAPMVITVSRLEEYLSSGRAQPWEKMALVRARHTGGSVVVGERVIDLLRRFTQTPPNGSGRRDIDRARKKASELQRAQSGVARIKKALGGMMDFEFAATLKAWRMDLKLPNDWWQQPISSRLDSLAGWLDKPLYTEAGRVYRELRRWELVQWVSKIGKRGAVPLDGDDAHRFALAAGIEPGELQERWGEIAEIGRRVYQDALSS
jgi:glutamate-ammonia-ligase adenylyltransferase